MIKLAAVSFFILLLASQSFGQVSLIRYITDWKSTKADLQRMIGKDKVKESNSQGMTFVYYKDKLFNQDVDVTYVYDAKGILEGKMLKNSVPNKSFFDSLLKEMLPLYGNNFRKGKAGKFSTYTWKSSAATSVSILQSGATAQLVCNKKK
jgi:hypothetical protein